MDWIAIAAATASILTALLSFFKLREERARASAETIRVTAEAEKIRSECASLAKKSDLDRALALIDELQEDNNRLRGELKENDKQVKQNYRQYQELQRENSELRIGVLILIEQLRTMGIEPRWFPSYTSMMTEADEADGK